MKIFTAEDAPSFTDALEKVIKKSGSGNAQENPDGKASTYGRWQDLSAFKQLNDSVRLKEFIAFLRKGQFNFVWGD